MDAKYLALRLVERCETYAQEHSIEAVRYPEQGWSRRMSSIAEHALDHQDAKYAALVIAADQRFALGRNLGPQPRAAGWARLEEIANLMDGLYSVKAPS